ncbi:hypothetical protein CL656_05250 [bacterium]|nr:hypothetical protein [bacterium]
MNSLSGIVTEKYKKYQDAVEHHNNALNKLNAFYGNYLDIPSKSREYLDKNVKDASGSNYYVTPQGLLKKLNNNGNKSDDCPSGSSSTINEAAPSYGLMTNIPLSYNKPLPEDTADNYFITGKSMKFNQPCSYFNQETSINLPDKSTNRQMKVCTYVFEDAQKSNMIEHDDLTNASLDECQVRAEDVGHDAFGIIKTNPRNFKGKCLTGNKKNVPQDGGDRDEIKEVINTDNSNATLTLLKNGNLIMWAPNNESNNYYNEQKQLQESTILWSSKGNNGKTDGRCDPIFGGSINNINVTYGTNCGLDIF